MSIEIYFFALLAIVSIGAVAWVYSVFIRNVAFVDSLWSLFFLVAALVYSYFAPDLSAGGLLVLALVAIWSLRLSIYITARNWGEEEDHRYQKIRENNQPHFWLKSFYIVFLLQGVLAWIISLPLLPAITDTGSLNALQWIGVGLWGVGVFFEAVGDYQLSSFKADPDSKGKVLDTGLWRYTRHPNYFGDFCVWWGFYLIAAGAGGWWAIPSPLIMSFLLLKVSGVAMLESTISERRPKYEDYIRRTNAFFPGPPKSE